MADAKAESMARDALFCQSRQQRKLIRSQRDGTDISVCAFFIGFSNPKKKNHEWHEFHESIIAVCRHFALGSMPAADATFKFPFVSFV
ncbi:hypothetical protein [Planctomicrobium piriforme]|uniref:Uncharacterized protein n=1 Tax=Planctomicrobium piriforme TaxID=1576369 RepID=A0A1I3DBP6_9PLAN|nr:hypothetical protein [Planctomicrobium piriforme]SFH84182.1 hypothetical protein SAMN05421753_103172 [Planctomicrobium piriforme]